MIGINVGEVLNAFRTNDAQALDTVSLHVSRTGALPWDRSPKPEEHALLDMIRASCDLGNVTCKAFTMSVWKLLVTCVKCSATQSHVRETLISVALSQVLRTLKRLADTCENDPIPQVCGDAVNSATFISVQWYSLCRAVPVACWSIALNSSDELPALIQIYQHCATIVSFFRSSANADLYMQEEKNFTNNVLSRLEASVTAMCLGIETLFDDLMRILSGAARKSSNDGDNSFTVQRIVTNKLRIATACFHFMITCCRATVPNTKDLSTCRTTKSILQSLMLWLPFMEHAIQPNTEMDLAVSTLAKNLSPSLFVEAPPLRILSGGLSDLGAAHKWFVVCARYALCLPPSAATSILSGALACPDDTSIERVGALWLTVIRFSDDVQRRALSKILLSIALTARNANNSSPVFHRIAHIAERLLRISAEEKFFQLFDPFSSAPSNSASSTAVFTEWVKRYEESLMELPEVWMYTDALLTPVLINKLLDAPSRLSPPSELRLHSIALLRAARPLCPLRIVNVIQACAARLDDNDFVALLRFLSALSISSVTVAQRDELMLADALRLAIKSMFGSIKPSFLAASTVALAHWAQVTTLDVEKILLSVAGAAELLEYHLTIHSSSDMISASCYSPPITTTAAATPLEQIRKKFRAEEAPDLSADDSGRVSGDLLPVTQANDFDILSDVSFRGALRQADEAISVLLQFTSDHFSEVQHTPIASSVAFRVRQLLRHIDPST